jgi:putative oxidoreductase
MYLEGVKQDDPAEDVVEDVDVRASRGTTMTESIRVWFNRAQPDLLSVLRIVAAFLFMIHGTQKLFGVPSANPREPVELASLMGAAGLIEFVGGALLLVGLLSRPVAFLLSGEMAAAYFLRHAPQGFWPALNGGELSALYCFLFLFLAAAGPGPWSLDHVLRTTRTHPPLGEAPRRWRTSHY